MTIITITITEDCDLMMLFFHGCSQRYASNHECVIYVSINVLQHDDTSFQGTWITYSKWLKKNRRWHVVQKYIKGFFVLPHNSCIFVAMRRAHSGMWIQLNFQRYLYLILAFYVFLFRFSFWLSRKHEPTNRPSNAWRGKRSNSRPFVKQSSGT